MKIVKIELSERAKYYLKNALKVIAFICSLPFWITGAPALYLGILFEKHYLSKRRELKEKEQNSFDSERGDNEKERKPKEVVF
jgi:hypothetical protein